MEREQNLQSDSQPDEENPSVRDQATPMEDDAGAPECRIKSPIEMDEETTSSTGTKTTDDDGSTAITSSSYSTSENTIDKDPESHSNECEKALEILKDFNFTLGETTPKKRDYSYGVDVDDAFENSSSVGRGASCLEVLIEDKLKLSETEAAVVEDAIAVSSITESKESQVSFWTFPLFFSLI